MGPAEPVRLVYFAPGSAALGAGKRAAPAKRVAPATRVASPPGISRSVGNKNSSERLSMQKILCSGIYKENMKDYCQNRVEEQAQSLMDKATAAFQQQNRGNDPTAPAPPPPSLLAPLCSDMMPTALIRGPPMMSWDLLLEWGCHGKPHVNDAYVSSDGNLPLLHDDAYSAWNDLTI
ncbi:U1 small nuclear ribonucleoprotein C [Plecturocebus cupreus]